MGLNVIFACNVRCKEPMGGQRGFGFRVKIRMIVFLKQGNVHGTVAGGGGSAEEKKDFGKPPCQLLM